MPTFLVHRKTGVKLPMNADVARNPMMDVVEEPDPQFKAAASATATEVKSKSKFKLKAKDKAKPADKAVDLSDIEIDDD